MNQEILQLTIDQYGSEYPVSLLSQYHHAVSYWKSKRLNPPAYPINFLINKHASPSSEMAGRVLAERKRLPE